MTVTCKCIFFKLTWIDETRPIDKIEKYVSLPVCLSVSAYISPSLSSTHTKTQINTHTDMYLKNRRTRLLVVSALITVALHFIFVMEKKIDLIFK